MPVSLYTIEIPAVHAGDQTISSMYDWWFYADTSGSAIHKEARRVRGSTKPKLHDRLLPSQYVKEACQLALKLCWTKALHSYVAMHEWKLVVPRNRYTLATVDPSVHMPLHELVHRVVGCESGISDECLLMLLTEEEQSIVGYTRTNPFRGVPLAPPR